MFLQRGWIILILLILGWHENAMATGDGVLENPVYSAKFLGEGNAATADPFEPTAISYNPAGIAYLDGTQTEGTLFGVSGWAYVDQDTGSARSGGSVIPIGTGYITQKLPDLQGTQVVCGVGMDSPFGLSKKSPSTFPAFSYTGFSGRLQMFTIKPTLAVKLNDSFSIGGGPVYNDILHYGAVAHYPNKLGVPVWPDGQARMDLSGNKWSWQAGALYRLNEKNNVGLYFRGPVVVPLHGKIKVQNSVLLGDFETNANSKLQLPLNLTLGYAFYPDKATALKLDLSYTRWSTIENSIINGDPTGSLLDDAIIAALGAANTNYLDAYSIAVGASHDLNEKWTIRGGSFFVFSPVRENNFTPLIPDANRLAFSCGIGYKLTKDVAVDLGYGLALNLTRTVSNSLTKTLGTSIDGDYFSMTHVIGVSVTMRK
ncbi:MAG: hypothetical protein AUJ72_04500 [Candidatus Omnitrophica bacterium CG1_02_46_14]|nr:MAG: hypothetical protein AUJ72_04500 [Candidatus Omnitrophica bacterium CG1_02_46_14]